MASTMEPLPGTADIWEPETRTWVRLETMAREVFSRYGYGELRTPIFERTDVFVRGIGDETEVVQKEMYTFEDRGGRSLTLRPEGTAGIMRAIASQGLSQGEEKRVFYIGPMFPGERPAAGRRRQFHQVGVEAVGRCNPAIDAECIAMQHDYLRAIGLPGAKVLLNSRGTVEDHQRISDAFREYFTPRTDDMCDDCRRRASTNVWRILDCKNSQCQSVIEGAPAIPDLLGVESRRFFDTVCELLDALDIAYEINPRLVRGLDYYEHTVFEVIYEGDELGAQNAISGGGRYRISLPGSNKSVEGVGFAAGLERLLLAQNAVSQEAASMGEIDIFVAALGEGTLSEGLRLAQELRRRGHRVIAETEGRSLKAQLRTANRVNASVALIRGENELANNTVTCKAMTGPDQDEVSLDSLDEWLAGHLLS
ncbi:MAG: histidine--tRNA ligase [Candidatus Pacebacteria bacterium]|nr:histidine--tRNA ligase [Candidatus Paceibacterota bacterium]